MNAKLRPHCIAAQRQSGLSLIELMIAMVISLLTVLAIAALISNQARQQRLGGSINDAQNNALIAISMLEKDLQQAGAGMASNAIQNCNRLFTSLDAGSGATAITNFDVAAVSIINGSGTTPDTLRVRYAESVRGEKALPLTVNMSNAVDDVTVASSYAVRANDLMLITNSADDCTLAQVSSVDTGPPQVLRTAPNASPSATAPNFNPASLPPAPWTTVNYTTALASQVFILGQFTQRSYSVNNTTAALEMQVQGSLNVATTPVAENIVDLQAQYGITSGAGSDTVTDWVPATGIWETTGTTPTAANRKRIKAIRFAVVARTGERDASNPTPAGSIVLWPAATTGQTSAVQTFTVTSGAAQQFRYRVLRMVVPLKNMLWTDLS